MISNELLFSVAVDYYEKKMTKSDIGKRLGVSHVQVGKYLNSATERGIVEIILNPPSVLPEEKERLSSLFREKYGLETLVLVTGTSSERNSYTFLVEGAVQYILDNFPNDACRMGFGLGRVMNEIVSYRLRIVDKRSRWKIVPILDYDNQEMAGEFYDYLSFSERFCQNWGVSLDKKTRQCLVSYLDGEDPDDSGYYDDLGIVIGGVGVPFSLNPKLRSIMFSRDELERIKGHDIAGDYLNYHFDDEGNVIKSHAMASSSIPIERLRAVGTRIAVANGYSKVGSIDGLLKTGLVNVLVTDLPTAKNILSLSMR